MASYFNTCRFCGKQDPDDTMVKYGRRHYAHFACYVDAGKKLADLHRWQVKQFPWRMLDQRGLLAEAQALCEPFKVEG